MVAVTADRQLSVRAGDVSSVEGVDPHRLEDDRVGSGVADAGVVREVGRSREQRLAQRAVAVGERISGQRRDDVSRCLRVGNA
jgi:hypothetical protein